MVTVNRLKAGQRDARLDPGLRSRAVDPYPGSGAVTNSVRVTLVPAAAKARRHQVEARIHWMLIASAVVAAVWAIPSVSPAELGVLGLASNLTALTYLGLAVLLIGFSVAVVRIRSEMLLAAYVVAVTVVIHGLGSFAYTHLRFPWAWKHVGIVDFIQRTGGVDTAIDSLNAYHNWPGAFGLNALLTDAAGLATPLSYAAWSPLAFNLLYLAALYMVFRTFTLDVRMIWTGLIVFSLGNWVGQDYFAPQAIAFLFYLVVIAVMLHWFSVDRMPHRNEQRPVESAMAGLVLLLVIGAMVVSHQLTPVMTIAALAGITLFRRTRLVWPALVVAGLMVAWVVGFARPFTEDYVPRVVADLANIGGRFESGLIDYGQVDTSQRIVSFAARGLTASVLGLAALGYLRSFRTGIKWRPAIVLAATPLFLVGASSYGDEILFRAFLFMLPMASILGGALWFSREPTRRGRLTMTTLAVSLLALAFMSIVAQHGNDVFTVFTDEEVAAATVMYEEAPAGSAVIQLSTSYATKFHRYENLTELSVSTFSATAKDRFLADPAGVFAEWLAEDEFTAGYVFLSRSQVADVTRRGALPESSPKQIENDLRSSRQFEILFDSPHAVLFQLKGRG